MTTELPKGPLAGVRVLEFEAIGPLPFAAMMLADMGASVIRITRPKADWPDLPLISRGRASIALDLKQEGDRAQLKALAERADVLLEGYRPGVIEKLGFGPDDVLQYNPSLVYGRVTGWGQTGARSDTAGHDINYLAVSGALAAITPPGEAPRAPLNLLGDYGSGSLYLVIGILGALVERQRSGRGQVVDASIVDGALSMLTNIFGMEQGGIKAYGADGLLVGLRPYYRTYRCQDGKFVAVGCLEAKFRRTMTDLMGLAPGSIDDDTGVAILEREFAKYPRSHWAALFDHTDACVSPVLELDEVHDDPHARDRQVFSRAEGYLSPAPAPRLSRSAIAAAATVDPQAALTLWGCRP